MKKLLFLALIIGLVAGFSSCQKDFNFDKGGDFEVFVKTPQMSARLAVADKQTVFIPDSMITALFWTDPLTNVQWILSGPIVDTFTSADQISLLFTYTGTYNLNIKSFGVDWDITIVVGTTPGISQVGARFLGSTFVDSSNLFYYTFRINKPIYVTTADTLFRISERADDISATYLPKFSGIAITTGGDSIDITFSYAPNSGPLSVKFIAGIMKAGKPVWFNADPADPYKCQDAPPALTDILQANLKNGQALTPSGTFSLPSGASTTMGDYKEQFQVNLLSINPSSGILNVWFYSLDASPTFRWTDTLSGTWNQVTTATYIGSGYWHTTLPLNPANDYYIYDWGTGTSTFVQNKFVKESSMYYTPTGAIVIYL
ncbi:MAG: hypothetical protein WC928_02325 [Patescibacteria group bacterium]|jgi:hypothetical protein